MLVDPFAPELTSARRERLRRVLSADHQGVPLLVADLTSIRYLTGFDGSNGALLIGADDQVLLTDSRYLQQASQQAPDVAVELARDPVAGILGRFDTSSVLVEGHAVSAATWAKHSLAHPKAVLVHDIVGRLRAVKDPAEAAVLQQACEVSAAALGAVLAEGVLGRTEREVARRLEWLLGEGPGEGPGFASIVASGPNGAVPHHSPTQRVIAPGDMLTIDFGARVRGYHADITRTFVVAADPSPWQQDVHAVVAAAQEAALSAVVGGASLSQVDAAARGLIRRRGYGEHFGHGLGHGVGLAIHEQPLIGPDSDGTLTAGMVITIEPGIYLPHKGGVRIEDTVLVERDGCRSLVDIDRGLVLVR